MLTIDLLVTRISGGKIEPAYARIDHGTIEIARSIVDAFQDHVGKRYGELLEAIEALEGVNYRLVRGLAQILERRCVIESDSEIDPLIARRMVFEESGGFVTNAENRAKVLENVSRRMFVEPSELERALWSDHEENLVLKEFRRVDPESLLRSYNLSLTQTLLFRATGMDLSIEDGYQQVFRKIKQLGLMYSVQDDRICIEGPVSVFKLTERYGTAIAKLLPTIIKSNRWSLRASILRKTFRGPRVYEFTLDHTRKDILPVQNNGSERSSYEFDSGVEQEFSRLSFPGWTLRREPGVLKAGPYVFIPDFSLERRGDKIYVEIVGFWTPEYLRNKIQKLNMLEERHKENLILIVNRNLACSAYDFQTKNIVFYDKRIPHLDIIKILRRYEEKQHSEDIKRLSDVEIVFDGDVVNLNELAQRYGVSTDALKEVIISKNIPGYLLLGEQLVRDRVLEEVREGIAGVTRYSDSIKILDGYGIKAHGEALRVLGYRVKWTGLDPDAAEIEVAE